MTSAEVTTEYLGRMVRQESRGWGDKINALRRIAREYSLPFWTLHNILIGRAKTVDGDLRDRVTAAFIDHCKAHAERLLHDAEMAKRAGQPNVNLAAIHDEIKALAAQLEAAKGDKAGARQLRL